MIDREQIGQLVIKHDFEDFKWIKSDAIKVAEWVRFKCLFGCRNYGKLGTCPPNVPDVDHCRKFFSEYDHALIIHLQKTFAQPDDYRSWSRKMGQGLLDLEREVFLAGYYKTFLVSFAACGLCEDCTAVKEDCKNQKLARPGADAMGIDVYATARGVGYPIQVLKGYEETMNRYAFLMIE